MKNSFKELEEEYANEYKNSFMQNDMKNVKGSMDILKFIGEVFELYVSKFFTTLIRNKNK